MYIKLAFFLLFFSGTVKSNGQIFNIRSFGAKGNGKTDDTHAIQAAIDKATASPSGIVYFPKGIYLVGSYIKTKNYLENYCLLIRSNIIFKGDGKTSTIKIADHLFDKEDSSANAHLFYGTLINNVQFTGLQINMNGSNNLTPKAFTKNGAAIFIKNSRGVSVKNITIKNCAGRNMIVALGKGSNLIIAKSSFLNGGYYVGSGIVNKYQDDFSFLYSEWDSTAVVNNTIQQQNLKIALSNYTGGIEIHGSWSRAAGNKITGCFPGLYVSSSWHAMENTVIDNNKLSNCVKGIILFVIHPMNNIAIQNNVIQLTESRRIKLGVQPGIEIPNGNAGQYSPQRANNAPLTNISIRDNTITSAVADNSSIKTAGMVLHSLQRSTVSGNIITGMNYGGIVLQGSKWGTDSVMITKNKISGFRFNTDDKAICGYVIITDTYSKKEKTAPGFRNIYISGNEFLTNTVAAKRRDFIATNRKFEGAYVAVPGPMIGQIHFDNNNFSGKGEKIRLLNTD